MRGRAIGLGLLGLGAFALVAALMVKVFLVPTLVTLPLDEKASPSAVGSNVDFFNQGELTQMNGLHATVTQRVAGDPTADGASNDVAVWNFGSVTKDSDGLQLDASTYRVCLDRHTAEAVDCPSQHVNYDRGAKISGLTLTFPFGTQKKDYDYFVATTGKAFPAKFQGTEKLDGVDVYRFVVTVPETVIKSTEVPGSLAGAPDQPTVQADAVYTNTRTMWVEPTSGVIVTAEEHPKVVLRGPDGTTGVTLLAGDFAGSDTTVADQAKTAKDLRSQISMVSTVLPLVLVVLGVLALIGGALLLRRSRRRPAGMHAASADTAETQLVHEGR